MTKVLRRIFNVSPGEGAAVLSLLLFIFFIQTVLSTGKILQYSVFLDSFGRKSLALAFLLAPLVLAVVSALYSGLVRRIRPGRLLPITLVVLAGGFVAWRTLLAPAPAPFPLPDVWRPEPVPPPLGAFSLYIWVEVASSIAIVQAWAYVSDVFDPRQAKRLIPLVGLGASLSFLVNGFVVSPLVRHVINAEDLAWAVASALLLAIALFWVARHTRLGRPRGGYQRADDRQRFLTSLRLGISQIASTPLLRVFALVTVATILSQGLLDFLFMNGLRAHFDKNELASFYALFFGALGTLQVLFQTFLSGRLITRFGSIVCLAILPVAVSVGAFAYLLVPLFVALIALRFGDRLLKQSFYSPSLQALYTPVPRAAKRQAMTLIKGVVSPLSFAAFGGLLLVLGDRVALRWLALGLAAVAGASALLILRKARPAYIQALRKALERRRLDADDLVADFAVPLDGETLATIRQAVFEEGQEGKAVFALRLLDGVRSPKVRDLLLEALSHPSGEVRQEASHLLAAQEQPADAEAIADALAAEPDSAVAAVHLASLATLGREGRAGSITERISHADPRIGAAALCAARCLSLEPERTDARAEAVLADPGVGNRETLARTIESFGQPGLVPWCGALLADEEPSVRGAALRAAAALRSGELLEQILECFTHRGPRDEAGAALAALGDEAVPALRTIAEDVKQPTSLRVRVPKLLASMDTDRAGSVLESLLSDPVEEIRYYAIRSLARITHHPGGYGAPPRKLLLERVRAEVLHAHWLETLRRGLSARLDPQRDSLLYSELGHRFGQSLARIFGLVSMLEDPKTAAIVQFNLQNGDPRLRAGAIELMDTAFSRPVADLTIPLVERPERTADLARLFSEAGTRLRDAVSDPISQVVAKGDGWLRTCAASGFPEPVARLDPTLTAEVKTMLPRIEQILFLQSVPIFRELSGEELHVIAGIAEAVSVPRGQVICQQGDPGDAMFIVLHGSVSIQVAGDEIVTLGPREVVGELAVLDNLPRSADAVAAEDTEVLRIDGQSFDELLQEKHQIVKGIFRVLTARIRQSTARRITAPEMPALSPSAK